MSLALSLYKVRSFRIDHCCFQDIAGSGVWVDAALGTGDYTTLNSSGVVDHSVFNNTVGYPGFANYNARTLGYGIGLRKWPTSLWDTDLTNIWGQNTLYTVFVEDNFFSKWRHVTCSNDGFHVVFRYNNVTGDYGQGSLDGHGSYADETNWDAVGTRCMEAYNNTFEYPDLTWGNETENKNWALNIRGGSWIVTNNTFINWTHILSFNNDWGNYAPYTPLSAVNFTHIWSNSIGASTMILYNADSVLERDYFYHEPNATQSGYPYASYEYPNPLTTQYYSSYTNDTLFLETGTYVVTVPETVVVELYTYNFSKWQDDSESTTFSVSLTVNTTITATYIDVTAATVVTVSSPSNVTYYSSIISVVMSASGGEIDEIWWNCKNGSSWIYGSNQTYTVATSMTGFTIGTSYTFYAWANNTDAEVGVSTVAFTVEIASFTGEWGGYWGRWWGYP
jgi:hypothetical protein